MGQVVGMKDKFGQYIERWRSRDLPQQTKLKPSGPRNVEKAEGEKIRSHPQGKRLSESLAPLGIKADAAPQSMR